MAKSAPVLLLWTPPPPSICRPSPFLFSTRFMRRKIHGRRARIRAVREWQDYEEAVKKKDLARALRFLKLKDELQDSSIESTRPVDEEFRLFGVERDLQVLNTCLNADDMRLVGSAYAFLTDRGLLANFGKYRNIGKFSAWFPCKKSLPVLFLEEVGFWCVCLSLHFVCSFDHSKRK